MGGLGASLDSPVVKDVLAQYGITLHDFLFRDVTFWTATLHGIMAIFIPLLGATFMVIWSGGKIGEVRDAVPSLILAGLCFAIPYWLLAKFFGPEFPSLVGGIVGLALYALLIKAGVVPKTTWDFKEKHVVIEEAKYEREFTMIEAMLPYVLVSIGLLATRLIPAVKAFSTSFLVIAVPKIFGTSLAHTFKLLYNPGTIFIIAVLLSNAIFRLKPSHTVNALKTTFRAVIPAAIALIFAVSLSQIMMNSGHNYAGMGSMLEVMAKSAAAATGKYYIFVAIFVGILGAYMAGSNTVSNILFGSFQFEAAKAVHLPKTIIVSLQNVGGAVGNMICVHNVVAVCTTCGILGSEGEVIRKNLAPTLIYAIVASLIAAIVVFVLGLNLI